MELESKSEGSFVPVRQQISTYEERAAREARSAFAAEARRTRDYHCVHQGEAVPPEVHHPHEGETPGVPHEGLPPGGFQEDTIYLLRPHQRRHDILYLPRTISQLAKMVLTETLHMEDQIFTDAVGSWMTVYELMFRSDDFCVSLLECINDLEAAGTRPSIVVTPPTSPERVAANQRKPVLPPLPGPDPFKIPKLPTLDGPDPFSIRTYVIYRTRRQATSKSSTDVSGSDGDSDDDHADHEAHIPTGRKLRGSPGAGRVAPTPSSGPTTSQEPEPETDVRSTGQEPGASRRPTVPSITTTRERAEKVKTLQSQVARKDADIDRTEEALARLTELLAANAQQSGSDLEATRAKHALLHSNLEKARKENTALKKQLQTQQRLNEEDRQLFGLNVGMELDRRDRRDTQIGEELYAVAVAVAVAAEDIPEPEPEPVPVPVPEPTKKQPGRCRCCGSRPEPRLRARPR